MRRNQPASIVALTLTGLLGAAVPAADHREAPLIQEDPSADIADVFAFLSPTDTDRLVLVRWQGAERRQRLPQCARTVTRWQ